MKKYVPILLCLALLMLSGCADSVSFEDAKTMDTVGFWRGLWHGIIAVFAFFVSLFSDSTAVYAIYNNGGWYDFGFLLGIGAFAGGCSSSSKR